MITNRLLSICFYSSLYTSEIGGLSGQPSQTMLTVRDPRPVMKAAENLEARYGWVITYEDPRWMLPDSVDVTEHVRRDMENQKRFPTVMRGMKVLVPSGGSLQFSADRNGPAATLRELLDQNMLAGNAGVFRVFETPGRYHIVPVSASGADGRPAQQQSLLESAITLAGAERTTLETLDAFCSSLSAASGRRVELGATPVVTFGRHRGTWQSQGENAREFLSGLLDEVGPGYSWQLLHDPGEDLSILNIHWIGNLTEEK